MSGFGVTGFPQYYCANLYCTRNRMYEWSFYLVVTPDLDAKNVVVREHYDQFASNLATLRLRFEHSEITLDIPQEGLVTREGWRIMPFCSPTISRKDVDGFKKGQDIPECQLIVQWERKDQKPVPLRHRVNLVGVKAPNNFIYLTVDPSMEVTLPQLICFKTRSGSINILERIGTHYWKLGVLLLDDTTGEVTQAIIEHHHEDATKINHQIFQKWIQSKGKLPVEWSTLIEVLKDVGLSELAIEMEQTLK